MPFTKLDRAASLLLDMSALLMASGANTNRVNLTLNRFASVLNCKVSSLISHKTLVITVLEEDTNLSYTKVQNIPPYAVNFTVISALSIASWKAVNNDWSIEQMEEEVNRIKGITRYPKLVVLAAVSLAGAGFCNLFGGDYLNMAVAFISTFLGLFVFQKVHEVKFNVYIRVFLGSLIASTIASLGVVYDLGTNPQTALATSVLFLVPGVPLINSFTDLMDNNILNGMVRFTTGLMTVMAITLGLFIAMLIFSVKLI